MINTKLKHTEFQPRRIGHVNLWVTRLEDSVKYYERVCGIELVRRERDIRIAFHSNGNTHHDIGIIEVSDGKDRIGRDGTVQIPAAAGKSPGLNHLGWEMESEADLVAAFKRAQANGLTIDRTVDHLISHSVYLRDPDGNNLEFYADALKDWRQIYNLEHEDEVTGKWDPLASPPSPAKNFVPDPEIRQVADAVLYPRRLGWATLGTRNFDEMRSFYETVVGLRAQDLPSAGGLRRAMFAGRTGEPSLYLIETGQDTSPGLKSFSFILEQDFDMPTLTERCREFGYPAPKEITTQAAHAVSLQGPDALTLEFHYRR